ncbi:response regulator [Cohnella suwonensis]|uniref:Response regulator n=1 Tax=Cohnella suwonensis TaxID=696072 RepID=A0ABW0LPP4_9BACL
MIRAVVVDDEKLVRKGFISLIDWSRFGIVIVGEAADGRSALDLLDKVDADLLFTDITMPAMSGFELIKQARHRFPRLQSVVLTCHHEFEFAQEALRLGAIDYIVKTLLEMDSADDAIRRIVERYEWEIGSRASMLANADRKRELAPTALVFRPLSDDEDGAALYRLGLVRRNPTEELDGVWMTQLVHPPTRDELEKEFGPELLRKWQVAVVTGLEERSWEEVRDVFERKLPSILFYVSGKDGLPRIAFEQLARDERIDSEVAMEWGRSLRWTLHANEWEVFQREALRAKPDPAEIARLAASLCEDWEGTLLPAADAAAMRTAKKTIRSWSDWSAWFRRFADLVQLRMVELSFSKEVMLCLIRAIRYMKDNAGDKINQADVAAYANMSRSYFSQCFARLAGEAFGVVLRNMRLEKAKTLLAESEAPVYEIASMAGFEDDKYFSKLFREQVGKLPSEYRAEKAKGGIP